MDKKFFAIIPILLLITLLYQNCSGKAGFTQRTDNEIAADNNDANGDYGTGGGGYTCVSGQKLSIYIDKDNSGRIVKDNYLGAIVSYEGSESPEDNYNYYSASAHPNIGPEPAGFEANVFFYDGAADGMALSFFSNVDEGGSEDNVVNMDITVEGHSGNDQVLLSDDNSELKEVSPHNYQGRFHYWSNTDGGVIGPFNKNDSFIIRVKLLGSGDVQSARFYSANGFDFSLSTDVSAVNSFIIANESYLHCK